MGGVRTNTYAHARSYQSTVPPYVHTRRRNRKSYGESVVLSLSLAPNVSPSSRRVVVGSNRGFFTHFPFPSTVHTHSLCLPAQAHILY